MNIVITASDNYYHYRILLRLVIICMYVCICESISCSDVRDAVDQGARSVRDLNRELSLGSQCGKCVCVARKVVKEHLEDSQYDLAIPA